jgi:hypothetical protein
MDRLQLIALDAEDLAVISAHLQDAVVRAADLAWRRRERRFAMLLRRFDWQAPAEHPRRRLSGLHFERVMAVRQRGAKPGKDAVLSLLAVTFEGGEAPSGAVTLVFSGGFAIRLDVECIEAQLKDLGPQWEAASRPVHPDADKDA